MSSKCICSICTCGKHHCQLRSCIFPSKDDIRNDLTEYTTKYIEHDANPVESFKPKHPPMPEGKMDGKTVHNTDFLPHDLEKPWRYIQKSWTKPPGNVENLTSYKKDYTHKDVPQTNLIRQVSKPIASGKFSGEPTYKTDYKKWEIIPELRRENEPWRKPTEKMVGESTCMRDYTYREGQPAVCLRRKSPDFLTEPLSNVTNYREIYVEHPLPNLFRKEAHAYKRPEVPIDSLSVTKRDYIGHTTGRPQDFGPDKTPIRCSIPFDSKTTFKDDYLEWPITKPKFHEYPRYKEPESKMASVTCHNQAYRKLPLIPREACRPRHKKLFPDVFSSHTTYKADYKPWEITCLPMKKMDTYVASDIPFKGVSSSKQDYIQFPFQEPECFRRSDTLKAGGEPFDDGTMYRSEYTHKEQLLCPVPYLGTKTIPLEFDRISETGHVLYKPIPGA